ncbi:MULTISPECIES: DUF3000 domain-containing protein [Actinomycetes]|uniref:DUF3000 domain-containing protein n=2 Tax=Actinomycetes TaxID=1760 RepID=A0ABP6LSG4_9MICC|nr:MULTISPECIES: DUF3000 domain-containing protein [unclassified Nesterenkonia]MDS2171961.1 DUF3000 domain-containing protein [Nesterenkonia sp. CL21]OSM44838.1 enoyl-CoA hydratase [Nesterenkonia sp. PF2B19]
MTALGPAGSAAGRGPGPQISTPGIDDLPESFRSALGELRRARPRTEAQVDEIPAPVKLAPYAVALRAEVLDPGARTPLHGPARLRPAPEDAELLATGRFILLHDPQGQETWGGTFRVVIYIRAELDADMGNDPLLAEVAWTWLSDSLDQCGVEHSHAGGTATRILSESFGSLEDRQASNTVELRASWTPSGPRLGRHLEAWADMVCSFAGLPPLPDGVVALPHVRRI